MTTAPSTALPPGFTDDRFRDVIAAFQAALGATQVLTGPAVEEHVDPFSFLGREATRPSAVVLPGSVEEVQAVVRIAGEYGVPLWAVSRGKELCIRRCQPARGRQRGG